LPSAQAWGTICRKKSLSYLGSLKGACVKRNVYTAESLERVLRIFESRYGISSEEFCERRRAGERLEGVAEGTTPALSAAQRSTCP
jgi:hypothetical protein